MKSPYFKSFLLSVVVSCCAACTTLDLGQFTESVTLGAGEPTSWLVGEWQSSGARHDASTQPGKEADWVVTAEPEGQLVFAHAGRRYEVYATSLDEPRSALLGVSRVQKDGTRGKEAMLYVARLNKDVLSIKVFNSTERDAECEGFGALLDEPTLSVAGNF